MALLKTIKEYLAVVGLKPNDISVKQPISFTDQSQDSIDVQRRLDKSFKQQEQQLQSMALKPHDKDCPDMLTCNKDVCWIWEPDKIVNIISKINTVDLED